MTRNFLMARRLAAHDVAGSAARGVAVLAFVTWRMTCGRHKSAFGASFLVATCHRALQRDAPSNKLVSRARGPEASWTAATAHALLALGFSFAVPPRGYCDRVGRKQVPIHSRDAARVGQLQVAVSPALLLPRLLANRSLPGGGHLMATRCRGAVTGSARERPARPRELSPNVAPQR